MRPADIQLLIHYFFEVGDHPSVKARVGAWPDWATGLVRQGLLKYTQYSASYTDAVQFEITDKGRYYVEHGLCKVPLPVAGFTIPAQEAR